MHGLGANKIGKLGSFERIVKAYVCETLIMLKYARQHQSSAKSVVDQADLSYHDCIQVTNSNLGL